MSSKTWILLCAIGLLIILMLLIIFSLFHKSESNNEAKYKGFINKMNHNYRVNKIGKLFPNHDLVKIFNRAKNPWKMTVPTFQFIRIAGFILFTIIAISLAFIKTSFGIFAFALAILCVWYPMYYYKAIGNEREAEWNKMYEFIWVLKNNISKYDPAKSFLNVKEFLQEHAPHNLELIGGFYDFYEKWNDDEIDPYIDRYYPFSIPREIFQIVFNMNKTGDFPEEQLNTLRQFIINAQDLTVEKELSGVSGKATICSLPFLMISVIVALLVPLISQIMRFL